MLYCYKPCEKQFLFFDRNLYLKVVTTLLRKDLCCKITQTVSLKRMSGIFYQFFIFLPNDSPLKTMKYVFFISSQKFFSFSRYSNFVFFFLPFRTFKIQKDKWMWNNL